MAIVYPPTLAASGLVLDDFIAEAGWVIYPDSLEASGVFFDDFYVEESVTFLPDTINLTTTIETPAIPITGSIYPATLEAFTIVITPTVFYAFESELVTPATIELRTTIPFPTIERTFQNHELTGEPIGFAIIPSMSISVERPEKVNRQVVYLKSVYIDTEEYRLYQGRPVGVPKWDVAATFLASSSKQYLGDREDPRDIEVGSQVRWLASETDWDPVYHRWTPTDDGLAQFMLWESSEVHTPVLHTNFQYAIGKEQFTRSCLSFDEDSYSSMWSSFERGVLASDSVVFMMVVSLNPVQRGQDYYVVLDSGAEPESWNGSLNSSFSDPWSPVGAVGNRTQCRVFPHRVRARYGDMSSGTSPDRNPTFGEIGILTMKFDSSDFYAEWVSDQGKFSHLKTAKAADVNNSELVYHRYALGRENGLVGIHNANMDVFEINMWTEDPTDEDLRLARRALVSSYGVTK